ncbi:hypothetical protein DIURU_000622 [Diutina rugosa]|uniref:Uncharacterized protein n=1 Tax=Diutina rugosa TaxID=5481 RepID=A0A642V2B8_DIURU|nr:uncharacterized protein DIURU_000622 [Diutina rugosa]KAA8907302.1 hypothetical protein DIURU_000622 [Diutina rugosa]
MSRPPNTQSSSQARRRKPRGVTSSLRFKQIAQVVKKFRPVTINGTTTRAIIDEVKANQTEDAQYYASRFSDNARLSLPLRYVADFMEKSPESAIYLSLMIKPSDPEFPFDMDSLNVNLTIPSSYPQTKARIVVLNEDVPRGVAVNVEMGFQKIARQSIPLVAQLEELDANLESLLAQEERTTIQFVKPSKSAAPTPIFTPTPTPTPKASPSPSVKATPSPEPEEEQPVSRECLARRQQLLDQFEAKLSPTLFKKAPKETKYRIKLPVPPNRVPDLWKRGVEIIVTIPRAYPDHDSISIQFANNFTTNLIVKNHKETSTPAELAKMTQHYKSIERNVCQNATQLSGSVVDTLNQLSNNFDKYTLSATEFDDWKQLSQALST